MTGTGCHDTREVRTHYAGLASSYDDKANRACKRAYARLVTRMLANAVRVLELGSGSSPLLDLLPAEFKVACDLSVDMLSRRVRFSPPTPAADATGSLPARLLPTNSALAGKLPVAPSPVSGTTGGPPPGALPSAVAADGQHMPFRDAAFDAVFSINVLEHVPGPAAVLSESARVLAPGGLFLAVTPNGDVAWLLELLERLHLKLPEGPHRFLGTVELAGLTGKDFIILEHRPFLAFPAGPERWVRAIDRMGAGKRGRGLFQYILLERR